MEADLDAFSKIILEVEDHSNGKVTRAPLVQVVYKTSSRAVAGRLLDTKEIEDLILHPFLRLSGNYTEGLSVSLNHDVFFGLKGHARTTILWAPQQPIARAKDRGPNHSPVRHASSTLLPKLGFQTNEIRKLDQRRRLLEAISPESSVVPVRQAGNLSFSVTFDHLARPEGARFDYFLSLAFTPHKVETKGPGVLNRWVTEATVGKLDPGLRPAIQGFIKSIGPGDELNEHEALKLSRIRPDWREVSRFYFLTKAFIDRRRPGRFAEIVGDVLLGMESGTMREPPRVLTSALKGEISRICDAWNATRNQGAYPPSG